MSTHNIGFYEDLTKIIFELPSNIIKYAPYFFSWLWSATEMSYNLENLNIETRSIPNVICEDL